MTTCDLERRQSMEYCYRSSGIVRSSLWVGTPVDIRAIIPRTIRGKSAGAPYRQQYQMQVQRRLEFITDWIEMSDLTLCVAFYTISILDDPRALVIYVLEYCL